LSGTVEYPQRGRAQFAISWQFWRSAWLDVVSSARLGWGDRVSLRPLCSWCSCASDPPD